MRGTHDSKEGRMVPIPCLASRIDQPKPDTPSKDPRIQSGRESAARERPMRLQHRSRGSQRCRLAEDGEQARAYRHGTPCHDRSEPEAPGPYAVRDKKRKKTWIHNSRDSEIRCKRVSAPSDHMRLPSPSPPRHKHERASPHLDGCRHVSLVLVSGGLAEPLAAPRASPGRPLGHIDRHHQ